MTDIYVRSDFKTSLNEWDHQSWNLKQFCLDIINGFGYMTQEVTEKGGAQPMRKISGYIFHHSHIFFQFIIHL